MRTERFLSAALIVFGASALSDGSALFWGGDPRSREVENAMRILAISLLLALSATACGGGGSEAGQKDPPPDGPWAQATVAYDPDCATGCVTLQSREPVHGVDLTILYNPDVDDPIAQWGDCLESFKVCITGGGAAAACSQQSQCPEVCRQDFETRVATLSDLAAQFDAFEAVYISDGAPCLPERTP
jgi:hypothetical protein